MYRWEMEQDDSILAAAFALRDRRGPVTPVVDHLRALLPRTRDDVLATDRQRLADDAITAIAEDPDELAWFRAHVARLKSFGSISTTPTADVYACPKCNYSWRQPGSDPVPKCPHDGLDLVLV